MTFQEQMESLGFKVMHRHYMSWYELTLPNGNKITLQNHTDATAPATPDEEVEVAVIDDEGKDVESFTWPEVDLSTLVNMIKELSRGNA